MIRIELDERQLRTVVSSRKCQRVTDPVSPGPGKTGRFVNVAVKGYQRLTFFNHLPDCDTPDMNVERGIVYHFAIEISPIEIRFVRWRMKQQDSVREIIRAYQFGQILANGRELLLIV